MTLWNLLLFWKAIKKKQKYYCTRLFKKERKRFLNELNPSFVMDNKAKKRKKYSCFQKCSWEKNLHLGSHKFIFLNRFSGDILFSSLVSFAFFVFFSFFFFFCLFACFLKLKMYVVIHIQLCGQVSDKKFFTWLISGNKTTFFLA